METGQERIEKAIEILDIFTDYFKCPEQQGCQNCRAEGYCADFEGREQMLEALSLAITALQEVADGRCVVLPCKVGDTVWLVSCDCLNRPSWITENNFEYGMLPHIGKTIFLTREEAEAALRKE
jgi:hypothetical protein